MPDSDVAPPAVDSLHPRRTLSRLLAAAPGAEPEVLTSLFPAQLPSADQAAAVDRPHHPGDDPPDDPLDAAFQRLAVLLDACVGEVSEEWGPPVFHGTVEEETFPPWSDALVLAAWWRDEKVAYLAVRHEADADPVTLEAGAHARDELDQLQAWHPEAPVAGAPP